MSSSSSVTELFSFCLCLFVGMLVGQSPPTLYCSHEVLHVRRLNCFDTGAWTCCSFQIYGSGAGERQTDKERKKKGQTKRQCGWIGLDHLSPCLPASLPAGLWLCGVSTPPVITLYDSLHSKCYINLVTPPDYTPPHTPLIMQTS